MATRLRDGGAPGKEKRGASPNADPAHRRKSPNPSPSRPLASSPSAEKNVPNYLRPTKSSSTSDHPAQPLKKPSTTDAAHKASLARRRSFDRAPQPSQPPKRVSPTPKERGPRSSAQSTGVAPQKTANAKASNDVSKKQSLYSRPLSFKKSNSNVKKKQEDSIGSASKAAVLESSTGVVEDPAPDHAVDTPQPHEEDPQSLVTDEEGTIDGSNNHEAPAETREEGKEQQNDDPVQVEPQSPEQQDVIATESPVVAADQDVVLDDVKTEAEPEDQKSPLGEETSEPEQQQLANKSTGNSTNENLGSEEKVEDQEKGAAGDATEVQNEKGEAVEESQPVDNSKETTEESSAGAAAEEAKNAAKNQAPVQGKKESSAVSNDVVEETARKLQEQRKNRVKALAGAFETVISLQEPK